MIEFTLAFCGKVDEVETHLDPPINGFTACPNDNSNASINDYVEIELYIT
jgi:hypothetical protein